MAAMTIMPRWRQVRHCWLTLGSHPFFSLAHFVQWLNATKAENLTKKLHPSSATSSTLKQRAEYLLGLWFRISWFRKWIWRQVKLGLGNSIIRGFNNIHKDVGQCPEGGGSSQWWLEWSGGGGLSWWAASVRPGQLADVLGAPLAPPILTGGCQLRAHAMQWIGGLGVA